MISIENFKSIFFMVSTEYHLLQAQVLLKYLFKKKINSILIIVDEGRCSDNLIIQKYWDKIIYLPHLLDDGSYKRLVKKWIINVEKVYSKIIIQNVGQKYDNSIFAFSNDIALEYGIIRKIINPSFLINFEDGMGNYYKWKFKRRITGKLKNFIYNSIYRLDYKIEIQYGVGRYNMTFRLFPQFSVGISKSIDMKKMFIIMSNLIYKQIRDNLTYISSTSLENIHVLYIASEPPIENFLNRFDTHNLLVKPKNNVLNSWLEYKKRNNELNVIEDIIPAELVILSLQNLDKIIFDVYSTVIFTSRVLNPKLEIIFSPHLKYKKKFNRLLLLLNNFKTNNTSNK